MQLGVIGTGQMAAQMVAAAGAISDLEVTSVLSRSQDRARIFCDTCAPAAQPFADFDAFLTNCDAIYIATPPDQHLAAILTALEAGKGVLCEKPMTLSLQDTAAVIAKSQDIGTPLMEALWTVTLPAYRALKAQIDQTSPKDRRMRFDFSYPLNADSAAHFFDQERGGVLLDRAVYGYAAALVLLGDIAEQTVAVERNQSGLDTAATLHLRHAAGGQSLVTLSFDHLGANSLDLATPQGVAQIGPSSLAAETLKWTPHQAPQAAGQSAAGSGVVSRLKSQPILRKVKSKLNAAKGSFHGFGASPYHAVLEEFAHVLRSGASQSAIAPLSLSQDIANWVADARQKS